MLIQIDIEADTIIGLFEVPGRFPGPRKPSRNTVWRWTTVGLRIKGVDERLKLPAVKLNGINCTSVEALSRFFRALNGQFDRSSAT